LSIEEFINYQISGIFLIAGSSHCIGIDTAKGILYDPALPYAVTLTNKNNIKKPSSPIALIRMCLGVKKGNLPCEIRRIVVHEPALKTKRIVVHEPALKTKIIN
jgi:hypothetical protein